MKPNMSSCVTLALWDQRQKAQSDNNIKFSQWREQIASGVSQETISKSNCRNHGDRAPCICECHSSLNSTKTRSVRCPWLNDSPKHLSPVSVAGMANRFRVTMVTVLLWIKTVADDPHILCLFHLRSANENQVMIYRHAN